MKKLLILLMILASPEISAATYPSNADLGDMGDFIVKISQNRGRSSVLMPVGPVLCQFPEAPGSTAGSVVRDNCIDVSNPLAPTEIKLLDTNNSLPGQPINAHGTVLRFDGTEYGNLYGGANTGYVTFDPTQPTSATQISNRPQQPTPWAFPVRYAEMTCPIGTAITQFWEYDFAGVADASIGPFGSPFVTFPHGSQGGTTGFPSCIGQYVVYGSDQQSTGFSMYDASGYKAGTLPRLQSTINPVHTEATSNTVGTGGYWATTYGTDRMLYSARRKGSGPLRQNPAFTAINFEDPLNPVASCYVNVEDGAGGGDGANPMYFGIKDQYVFIDEYRIDLPACETEYGPGDDSPGVITPAERALVMHKFVMPAGEGCDGSQYFRALGQLGVFGGIETFGTPEDDQGNCFFVIQDDPDTTPPYVLGHYPKDGQTNVPTDIFNIAIHISDTIRSETGPRAITITNVDTTAVLKPVTVGDATGTSGDFKHHIDHMQLISIWPNAELEENTTYRVDVSDTSIPGDTAIQDFSGNVMAPFSFTFTTGDTITGGGGGPADDPAVDYSGERYIAAQSSGIECQADLIDADVWTVNKDNHSISILRPVRDIDTKEVTLTLLKEIKTLYKHPTSVERVGAQFAVTHRDDDKVVFYTADGFPVATVDTGHGSGPVQSVAQGSRLFVSLEGSGEVAEIDSTAHSISNRLTVGSMPHAMALHDDRLLVTRRISPATHGEVYDLSVSSGLALTRTIQLAKIQTGNTIDRGNGVPNYLRSIVINAAGTRAYVTANKMDIDNPILDPDNTVRPHIGIIDLVNNRDANVDPTTTAGHIDLDNGADPRGITYSVDPGIRINAMQGNNAIIVNDLVNNRVAQFATGAAPQDVCATLRTAYVKNFGGRSLTAVNLAEFMFDGSTAQEINTTSTVTNEIKSAPELAGLVEFYSAKAEVSPENYIACASCHDEAADDGMAWNMSVMGEGVRNTISLNGSQGVLQNPLLHWSANFNEVQDFEIQIETLNGGIGLIPGTQAGNDPISVAHAGQSVDMDNLAAYPNGLGRDELKRSPHRDYTGNLTANAVLGQSLFTSEGCNSCHIPAQGFRDTLTHAIGTINAESGDRLGGAFTEVRTPGLLGAFATAPYGHRGSEATCQDVIDGTYGTHDSVTNTTDRDNVCEYVLSLDIDEAPTDL